MPEPTQPRGFLRSGVTTTSLFRTHYSSNYASRSPTPPALESEVLTTRPPGKSLHCSFLKISIPLFLSLSLLIWVPFLFEPDSSFLPPTWVHLVFQSPVLMPHPLQYLPRLLLWLFFLLSIIIFWTRSAACRILVPRWGIKPPPPVVEAQSPNHWTTRNIPNYSIYNLCCCSVAQSRPTLQLRLPCPSPSPRVCSDPYPLSQWCHPTIASSVTPFSSCPKSLLASGSFPMSRLFAIRWLKHWSFTFSISPSNEYSGLISFRIDCLTVLISLMSKRLSRVFSSTTVQKHQFFGATPSLWSNSHIHKTY